MSETTKTSQSIFTILDTLETETSVPGATPKMQKHTLDREKFPTSAQFENEEKLLAWAKEKGYLHACLQKGVRAHLIDCRARFKSCKKNDIWSNEYGQLNLDNFEWEVQERPNGGSKKLVEKEVETLVKSIKTMLELGLSLDLIKPKLEENYSPAIVEIAISLIKG